MDKYTFKVVYELEGAEGSFLSDAKTEAKAKTECRKWVKATFPGFAKPKIRYAIEWKGSNSHRRD